MNPKFINVELENLVLGNLSALSNPNNPVLIEAIDRLHVSCFTGYGRQALFTIMAKNHVNGKEIADYAILMDLFDSDSDLIDLLQDLKPEITEPHSLLSWICDLNALRIDRGYSELIDYLRTCFDLECDREARDSIISNVSDKVLALKDINGSNNSFIRSSSECIDDLLNEEINGEERIRTGLKDLDEFLKGGLDQASLVVIGGAPSAGKTHMALKILLECHSLQENKEALVFSLEGKGTNVTKRLISHQQGFLYKNLNPVQRTKALEQFRHSNISISDKQNLSLEKITSICKRANIRNKISVVLVDYLDRVKKPSGDMRQDEKLAEIANGLANLAIELNCIVILTTQLNKEAIKKENHRPSPVDSKNSSGQAEAASYWFGIKRIAQWDEGVRYSDSNLVELIVGKNRNDEIEGVVYFETRDSLYFDINQEVARQKVENGDMERKSSKKRFDTLFTREK